MFKTRITELFGIDYPIVQGGLMWIARAELVSAVANAGSRASVIRVLASIGSWFRNTAIWPPSLDRTPIARPIPPYSSANTTIAAHAGPTGRKSVFRTGVFKDGRNASRLASESARGSDERLNMNHASATSRES